MFEQEIFIISQRGVDGEFPRKLSKIVTMARYGNHEQFWEDIEEAREAFNKFDVELRPFYSIFRCNIQVIEKVETQ